MTVLPVFPEGDDPNDRSLQLSLAFSHVTMLFTGDATPEVEAAMLALELQPVTVLKVAHHGSRFTTGLPFVRAVRPELSVISVGFNTYGHPSPDVLSNLAAVGSQVCRTDHAGAIRLRTDGRKVDADTWLRQHTTSP
jgi:competence protein ComEC